MAPLIDAVQHAPVGRIMSSFVLQAYAAAYDDVRLADYVPRWKQALVQDMAGRCLAGRQALLSVLQALLLRGSVCAASPGSGALGARLAQNTPERPIAAPLLIAQGQADDLVLPGVQARFIARRCAAGQVIQAWRYPGRDHLSVVAPDSPLAAHLIAWTQDRLGGKAAPAQCLDEMR